MKVSKVLPYEATLAAAKLLAKNYSLHEQDKFIRVVHDIVTLMTTSCHLSNDHLDEGVQVRGSWATNTNISLPPWA